MSVKIIRSTKLSLKNTNAHKLRILDAVITEYGRVVNLFIDQFWDMPELLSKSKLLKPIIDSVLPTWLSYRVRQAAVREAIGMISAVRVSSIATGNKASKPVHRCNCMQVSNILCLKDKKSSSIFDCWLHLFSIGTHPTYGRVILDLPVRLHKHYHKLVAMGGSRQNSYLITRKYVQVSFKVETGAKMASNRTIGVDTGILTLASTSTGHQFGKDVAGLVERIKRCQHGSKGQQKARRALRQRMDEVAIELFDTLSPTVVVAENLKGLSYKTKVKRRLTKSMRRSIGSWAYRYWLGRLERECEVRRSRFRSVNPYKTSQRCSSCGFTDRSNRAGEVFLCRKCCYTDNADINAAKNIETRFLTGPYGAGCESLLVKRLYNPSSLAYTPQQPTKPR